MTRKEHLLKIAEEECSEIAQIISKAMRFGVYDFEPGTVATNNTRIYQELSDLQAMIEMLEDENIILRPRQDTIDDWKALKKEKVEKFLEYSKGCGTLSEHQV